MIDYEIRPVLMGGVIRQVSDDGVIKINLNGRLGVIYVPASYCDGKASPAAKMKLSFVFSYIWITDELLTFDPADLNPFYGVTPTLLGGTLTEVNDTAVLVSFLGGAGSVAVPRRWVFTDKTLEVGQFCQFYFSRLQEAADDRTEAQ